MTQFKQLEWRWVVGYEHKYEVSSTGLVRSVDRKVSATQTSKGKMISIQKDRNGYCFVSLWKNNKGKTHLVHRIVALSFLEKSNEYNVVHHKNSIKHDNNVDNLMWCNTSINNEEALKVGIYNKEENHKWAILTNEQVLVIFESEKDCKSLAKEYKVHPHTIRNIKNKKAWRFLTQNLKYDIYNKPILKDKKKSLPVGIVVPSHDSNKYQVAVYANGKLNQIGTYKTLDEAKIAYKEGYFRLKGTYPRSSMYDIKEKR